MDDPSIRDPATTPIVASTAPLVGFTGNRRVMEIPPGALPPEAAAWTPFTRYQYYRILRRFETFQASCPDLPLTEQISQFMSSLRPAMTKCARLALKARYRRGGAVDWTAVPRWPERRDEAVLHATVLDQATDLPRLHDSLDLRERALIELCYTLRRFEVVKSRWADLNLERGLVYVCGKGGKSTYTLLTPAAVATLTALRRQTAPADETAVIFPGLRGQPMHPGSLSHLLRRILRRAGVYRRFRGAHAFRRTFATAYLKANPQDLPGLKRLLRHSSVNTTTQYVFMAPEELGLRVARAFGSAEAVSRPAAALAPPAPVPTPDPGPPPPVTAPVLHAAPAAALARQLRGWAMMLDGLIALRDPERLSEVGPQMSEALRRLAETVGRHGGDHGV